MAAQLTRNQSLALLGFTASVLVLNAIGGAAVVKSHDRIVAKYANLVAVGESLTRITTYQAQLMNKHIDVDSIDEFDRMVMEDMGSDLSETLAVFRQLHGEGEPKVS